MRCEARTLDDIRALGGNDLDDERMFEAAARLSEINLALYRTFAQPAVRAMVTPPLAEAMRRMHPLRLPYEMFGPQQPVDGLGRRRGRAGPRPPRSPPAPTTRSLAVQAQVSEQIVEGLDAWRKAMERLSEDTFPPSMARRRCRPRSASTPPRQQRPRKAARSQLHEALVERAHRRAARRHDPGRASRGAGPRAALCRHAAQRGRRARLRGDPPPARRPSGEPAADPGRVQGDGPRAVPDAGRSTRRRRFAPIPGLLPEPVEERRAAFATLRERARGERRARRRTGRAPAPRRRALRPRTRSCVTSRKAS